jgi:hypothetical protein
LTVLPSDKSFAAWTLASLAMLALKPPQSPRSAVITTKSCTLSLPVPDSSFGAVSDPPAAAARPAITAVNRSV